MPFAHTLLTWYDDHKRSLPWRGEKDPYKIWISEIILQQTRVQQGWDYYLRFIAAFPDVQTLADAEEEQVLRRWQGLGYYTRARNLHAAAQQIVDKHHGLFPDSYEEIRALKGVGDYTAAAIGSFCFGISAAVVDGNVYRVLARYYGLETPLGTAAAKKAFTALAQSLLPEDAASFNQAMMDFGALQCTPAAPACDSCPLQNGCNAFRTGRTRLLPVRPKAAGPRERRLSYLYLRCQGQTPIRRRGPGDIWQGLWEPLCWEDAQPDLPDCRLLKKQVKHQLTHRTLWADFYLAETDRKPALPPGYRWIPESDLDRYGKPRLFEQLLETVQQYQNQHEN